MLSAKFGHFLDIPFSQIAKRIPFSPNTLTIIGFLITVIAALMIPHNIRLGGILILIGGIFDVLDGVVARSKGKASKFGAFLDSVLDRYSDAFLFLSIAWYLAGKGIHTGAFLSLGTLVGAFLISYARARAEGLGESCANAAGKLAERKFMYEVSLSSQIAFEFESSKLTPAAKQALDAFVSHLKSNNKNVYIEIQGHTDNSGAEPTNRKLGLARAEAVHRYLAINGGIALHRMNVISYGESAPVADNKTRAGRMENRRVTLVVLQ